MKKIKWIALLLVLTVVMSLAAACGGAGKKAEDGKQTETTAGQNAQEGNTSTEPAKEAKKPVTIDFWHIYSDGSARGAEVTKLINDFMKENPHITVKDLGVSFWDYWGKLSTAMASGAGPDVAINDNSTIPQRAKPGATLKLDDYIARDGVDMNQYFPVLVKNATYNGSIYAMPFNTAARVLYYNKAAFREAGLDPEKPPKNWEELELYAEKLTKWNDKGMLEQVGFNPNMGNAYIWTYAWTNGAKFFDENENPTINTPEILETLQWMYRINEKYGNKAMGAFNSQYGSLGYSPFIAGRVAMIVDVNTLYGDILKYAPDLDFGVAPIPYQKENVTWSAGFVLELVDNKNQERADAGWELMKFLTGKEAQTQFVRTTKDLMANQLASTADEFMSDPVWKVFIEQLAVARFTDYIEAAPSWHGTVQTEVENVMNEVKTPEKALEHAQKAVMAAIENYKKANAGQ